MTAEFIELVSAVIRLIIAAMTVAFSTFMLPWVRDELIPWLKEKHLYSLVVKFVRAAEKMYEAGTLVGLKKAYVISLLKERGFELTPEIDAFIESAVKELDIAVDSSIGDIVGEFIEDENAKEAEEEHV